MPGAIARHLDGALSDDAVRRDAVDGVRAQAGVVRAELCEGDEGAVCEFHGVNPFFRIGLHEETFRERIVVYISNQSPISQNTPSPQASSIAIYPSASGSIREDTPFCQSVTGASVLIRADAVRFL